jgi:hypothetical protein
MLLVDEITRRGVPPVVAELGPGDSIGTGIAALLSGASRYIGVDARRFVDPAASAEIARELVELFRSRHPFPMTGCSEIRHLLDDRSFPSALLDQSRQTEILSEERVSKILFETDKVLSGSDSPMIAYRAPLDDPSVVEDNSLDLVISQSVLEHVVDLRRTLGNVFRWLKPGALTSHQFDLTSHSIVSPWDGHREFSDRWSKLVVGKRPFMINRLSYSAIVATFEECGFLILRAERSLTPPSIPRSSLSGEWRDASDDDLGTSSGYVIAQKPV